ncbi:multiple coagulation factor deficiency protein 2-like [Lingula anatina]|uniref:Multiple coagulation factor deficiency protein 2-like n=1 Tax=Lingula anatina TaxID=7574 RepID=A0A1S3H1N1_LINAN|nr:multiple coagulation factor deficiency protein 2-like [Lingula anatina]XP_013395908.1 multiple coagulation factor deficiency protein 2-like [Lingula anatina]|eukprot:XP_013379049.1 multiple coagulation factor deficiency protein 2-like [Lingula anatina]
MKWLLLSAGLLLVGTVYGHGEHHQQPQGGGQNVRMHDAHHVNDAEHLKEHLDGKANVDFSKMSEQEIQFYYFKMHDYDHNNKLDGLELSKAMTHFHHENDPNNVQKALADEEISNMVETILREDDSSNDGYIDYTEFVTAQKRNQENARIHQQQQMDQHQQQQQQHMQQQQQPPHP